MREEDTPAVRIRDDERLGYGKMGGIRQDDGPVVQSRGHAILIGGAMSPRRSPS